MQQALDRRIAGLGEVSGGILKLFDVSLSGSKAEDDIARALRTVKASMGEMRNVLRDIKELSTTKPIDPDNATSDLFLQVQRDLKEYIEEMDAWLKDHPQPSEPLHAGHDKLRRALVQWHRLMGELRTNILEHDADCSATIGTFDNADDLIRALDQD